MAATTACLLLGCAASEASSLVAAGAPSAICSPQDQEGRAVIGYDVLENLSSEVVRVKSAELVGAQSLDLLVAGLYPVDSPHFSGVSSDYADAPSEWHLGDILAGEQVELVLGVKADAAGGTADAVELTVEEEGGSARTLTTTQLTLAPAGEWCTEQDIEIRNSE